MSDNIITMHDVLVEKSDEVKKLQAAHQALQLKYELAFAALETIVPVMQNIMLHQGAFMTPTDRASRNGILKMCEEVLEEQSGELST